MLDRLVGINLITIYGKRADVTTGMYGSSNFTDRYSLDEDYVYPLGPLWDGETLVQDRPQVD
jgi:hypothetical protein